MDFYEFLPQGFIPKRKFEIVFVCAIVLHVKEKGTTFLVSRQYLMYKCMDLDEIVPKASYC